MAVALAGLSGGGWVSRRLGGASRVRRMLSGLVALVLLSVLAIVWSTDWLLDVAAGFLGFGALAALASRDVSDREVPLLLGVLAGMVACAAGLVGYLSLPGAVVPAVALAVALCMVTAGRRPASAGAPVAPNVPPAMLVAAGIGAAGAALVRNHLPATGSAAYAVTELGAAFALGLLARAHALRQRDLGASDLLLGSAGIAVLVCVNALTFVLYPDLLAGGSAAYQTSPHLLTAGRTFPFWLIAFGFGVFSAPLWSSQGTLLAAAAGAAAAGLLSPAYLWPSVVAGLLCLFCCAAPTLRGGEGTRSLRFGSLGLVIASLAALLLLDPHGDWRGIRRTISSLPGEQSTPVPDRWDGEFGRDGLHVYSSEGGLFRVWNGQVLSAGEQGERVATPVRLGVGLGLACAGLERPVAVVGPPLPETIEGLKLLSTHVPLDILPPGGASPDGSYGLIMCGPGALSSLRNPLALLSGERLKGLQDRLAAGGTFVLWLPLARIPERTLLQILATVDLTFGGYDVYVSGSDALVVAGRRRPHFGRLRAHFGDAAKRGWMQDGDYWEPVELLADFATEAQDLRPVTELAGTLSVAWPARPVRLGRDLGAPRSPVAAASILQNRLMDSQRLLSRVTFQSEKQRYVALRGFPTYYRTMTRRLLQRLPGENEAHQRQLIAFLQGPHARLDLMAPQADTRLMQLADAMLTFGMPKRSVELLEDAVDSGREDFALRSRLGKALADADQYREALGHYRRALELRPGSVETMRRIAALLLQTGNFGEGAEMLRRVIEQEPENTVDLLMLATLDARMGDLEEAERLARRVLRLDPDNADAQALVELARQGTAPSAGDEAPELPGHPAYQRGQR
ncbi:MAG: tetratricopeptide repeat protein [Planctomycetota bacterium]